MNTMPIVILSSQPGVAPLCLTLDAGGAQWRRLEPGDPPEEAVLVVPGIEAPARWLHLPTRNLAQALAAARLQWEDEGALQGEALHVALGPLLDDGHRLAVAVSRERMQAWLDMAARHGIAPMRVVPDHLALPEPPDGETVGARMPDGTAIVRGARLAFACEMEMLPALLGVQTVKSLEPGQAARLITDGVGDPVIDLLQGDFAPQGNGWRRDRRLLRIAVLAGLLLASPVLLKLGEGLRLHFAAQRLQSESIAMASSVAPGPDPVRALMDRARRADLAAGGGVAGMLATLWATLGRQADVQLEGLGVADGAVTAVLRHASPGELEVLASALRAGGVAMTVEASRPDAGRTVSDIRLGDVP